MKITALTAQTKNQNRVNVFVDGKYKFSLDVSQVVSLGLKRNVEYSEEELQHLEEEGAFGKLYARTLEYCMMRPHSVQEVRDYLWKKTRTTTYKSRTGELKERAGVSQQLTERVLEKLQEKNYVNDDNFARYWVEYRNQTKGTSRRKLEAELRTKGVPSTSIEHAFHETERDDDEEIQKIIAKKRRRYDDENKFIAYLARQGFSYDTIQRALRDED